MAHFKILFLSFTILKSPTICLIQPWEAQDSDVNCRNEKNNKLNEFYVVVVTLLLLSLTGLRSVVDG